MNVLTCLSRVASDLHEESANFGQPWTIEEVIGYLNAAEKIFLQQTGILKSDITQAVTSLILIDRPANVIDIDRISFNGKPLRRQTSWDLERENRSWRAVTSGTPSYWHEDGVAVDKFELDKVKVGTLRIFADTQPTAYTSIYDTLHLHDTWEQYLRWKVLAYCLQKDSDQQDLARSKYADQRFRFGIHLARRLMTGSLTVER